MWIHNAQGLAHLNGIQPSLMSLMLPVLLLLCQVKMSAMKRVYSLYTSTICTACMHYKNIALYSLENLCLCPQKWRPSVSQAHMVTHSYSKYIKCTPACPTLKQCCLTALSTDPSWQNSLRSRPHLTQTHIIQSPWPFPKDPSPNGALICVYQPWDEVHMCVPLCYVL